MTDPLADVLRTAADMDTSLQTWEYDFGVLARAAREHIAAEVSEMGAPEEGEFRCTCAECSRCLYWDLYERIAARIARRNYG